MAIFRVDLLRRPEASDIVGSLVEGYRRFFFEQSSAALSIQEDPILAGVQ